MYWAKLTTIALFGGLPAINAQTSARMLRFACSQLVVERLDLLVSSGVIGSPHIHQVVGGNSFNATMEPVAYDLPTKSSCTSCALSEDLVIIGRQRCIIGLVMECTSAWHSSRMVV